MTTRQRKRKSRSCVQLPFMSNSNTAIYARIETAQAQPDPVEALRMYAQELGYAVEQITVYTDTGESATAPIRERKGYTSLLHAIRQGEIHVVYLHAEGHIFTGADELQVNTFIHLCIVTGVFIITLEGMYDMGNLSHVAAFRAACIRAFLKNK